MRLKWLCLTSLLWASAALAQNSPAPVLFFSDLQYGPATGNSDTTYSANGGAYVTLYGNFLSPVSSVTLNGASCLTIVLQPSTWMWYQKMTVQLTSTCTSGNFVVTTAAGTSNGLPFTVDNTFKIYYVSTSGSDSAAGTFQAPWASIPHAVQTTGASGGNITYFENGYSATTDDGQGFGVVALLRAAQCVNSTTKPDANVAYPGATVTLGSSSGIRAVRTDSHCVGNWVYAGFTMRGSSSTVDVDGVTNYPTGGTSGWRIIGNDLSCPPANSAVGCFYAGNVDNATGVNGEMGNWFLGNNIHDVGTTAAQPNTDQQHGAYIGNQSRHAEFGWNTIANVQACRGFQTNSSFSDIFDLMIHDNTIHDTTCDGIVITSIDPSRGTMRIYNNVIWNTGKGPATKEGGGAWNCIYMALFNSSGNNGTEQVYNNSCFAPGLIQNYGASGCYASGYRASGTSKYSANFTNNVTYNTGTSPNCPSGIPFWGTSATFNPPVPMTGDHNLGWGVNPTQGLPANTAEMIFTNSLNADPLYVNPSLSGCPSACVTDLHISSASSPLIGAGTNTFVPVYDHDGRVRPSPSSIGAYEFTAGTITRPAPPTGLTVIVR